MYESFKQGAPAELWQALVREAGQRIARPLDESREHYLVFVLLRFQRDAHLLSRTQALAWLHSQDQIGSVRADALRDVGDGCLLIAGLFPGVAQRRRLSIDYYIDLGRGAYSEVADTRCSDASLFAQLAASYRELVRILTALRTPRDWQPGAGGILHA
ncbi:hypothetical protein [Xanthomonas vesicatoria]|uniref:hypothetical protein n=1 Tax=Xanthomonas vesicatoria TaxID=56460 RepID=UPI0007322B9E|nr:hypothetical protein [Xanthomonas vesicatoria]KTF29593.1 hypothetical protein LMG919_22370 [Xanthomonas vesicatoria]MCC8559621.1 hypothetical protein [Xanthomonas vesicatoria]MCC8602619.1 hypothetical protein [Xanthomonas vesicatoria]MCC8611124.1 hypothetical protein [Xanthomonas vesicatoria]MCC8619381.1 hypothetical protein [Xanthomonas vesicatoria]